MNRLLTATVSTLALSILFVPSAKAINQIERLQLLPQIAYPVTTIQPGQSEKPAPTMQPSATTQPMQSQKEKALETAPTSEPTRPSFDYFEEIFRQRYGN